MPWKVIAQGFLFRRQEPDTRDHPNRQPDGPTVPRKDRVEASFDSINPSSLKEMSGNKKEARVPRLMKKCRKSMQLYPAFGAAYSLLGGVCLQRLLQQALFVGMRFEGDGS